MFEVAIEPGEIAFPARSHQRDWTHVIRVVVDYPSYPDQLASNVIVILENGGGLIAF
jgi:hypothetical protein